MYFSNWLIANLRTKFDEWSSTWIHIFYFAGGLASPHSPMSKLSIDVVHVIAQANELVFIPVPIL